MTQKFKTLEQKLIENGKLSMLFFHKYNSGTDIKRLTASEWCNNIQTLHQKQRNTRFLSQHQPEQLLT